MREMTREEHQQAFNRMAAAHHMLAPVETNARVVFHDSDQESVKVLVPAPRMMAALMAGGFIARIRVVGADEETGGPLIEGDGEIMGPMTHDEAVAFIAWKDLPRGCNRFAFLTTDDLPRIDGCPARARAFRAAWRLGEET